MSTSEQRQALAEQLRKKYGHEWCVVEKDGRDGMPRYDLSRHPLIAEAIADLTSAPEAAVEPTKEEMFSRRGMGLLKEALATLEMWADVAPAVSLRHDIAQYLSLDTTPKAEAAQVAAGSE